MKAPKILLHLGLPKTATSSLQHNVLQSLHEKGRINFLGKCLSYDLVSKKLDIKNYTGKFIRDGAEGSVPVEVVRKKLSLVLVEDKINVFSDEGLMIAYPGKNNIDLATKFKNLAEIFQGYNVDVIFTLRDPVDYLYSLYVELYPDYYSKFRAANSVEKYANMLINEPDKLLFESLFFESWGGEIRKHFPVTMLSFEKIACGDKASFASWADALGISVFDFTLLFNEKKINVKRKEGKEVNKIRDFTRIESVIKGVTAKVKPLYYLSRWFYNFSGLKSLLNLRIVTNKSHEYPSGETLEKIRGVLKVSSQINENL